MSEEIPIDFAVILNAALDFRLLEELCENMIQRRTHRLIADQDEHDTITLRGEIKALRALSKTGERVRVILENSANKV